VPPSSAALLSCHSETGNKEPGGLGLRLMQWLVSQCACVVVYPLSCTRGPAAAFTDWVRHWQGQAGPTSCVSLLLWLVSENSPISTGVTGYFTRLLWLYNCTGRPTSLVSVCGGLVWLYRETVSWNVHRLSWLEEHLTAGKCLPCCLVRWGRGQRGGNVGRSVCLSEQTVVSQDSISKETAGWDVWGVLQARPVRLNIKCQSDRSGPDRRSGPCI